MSQIQRFNFFVFVCFLLVLVLVVLLVSPNRNFDELSIQNPLYNLEGLIHP